MVAVPYCVQLIFQLGVVPTFLTMSVVLFRQKYKQTNKQTKNPHNNNSSANLNPFRSTRSRAQAIPGTSRSDLTSRSLCSSPTFFVMRLIHFPLLYWTIATQSILKGVVWLRKKLKIFLRIRQTTYSSWRFWYSRIRVDGQIRLENITCGRVFLQVRRKKNVPFKIPG